MEVSGAPAGAPVIVNADDFGLKPEVNEAVRRAHLDGVLTSATLLVNAPGTADAVAMARDLPDLGVGLHLALTELEPLTRAPSLAPGGRFPATHGRVFARLLMEQVPTTEVRDEVRAQVEAALATDLPIDHVDGHGHVHVIPVVLDALVAACDEFGIGAMRWPHEPGWEPAEGLAKPKLMERAKRALLRRLCRRGAASVAHLKRPAGCLGIGWSGALVGERLPAAARWAGRQPAITEIMVHPALYDDAAYPGYLGGRELDALTAPETAAALPQRVTFAAL